MSSAGMELFKPEIEQQMRDFYRTLSEKDRRRYAGMEASKLPHGGIEYVAQVLECDTQTVARGMREIEQLSDGDPLGDRVRRKGAGRPKKR